MSKKNPSPKENGPVLVPANEATEPAEETKGPKIFPVPAHIMELLQAEIALHNTAMNRWNLKLQAAALASGVPDGSRFNFKQNPDGTFIFIVQ